MWPLPRKDLTKMQYEADENVDRSDEGDSMADRVKAAYKDPEKHADLINLWVNELGPHVFVMDVNTPKDSEWNTGNCIDEEIFSYMARDIRSPVISPTSKFTMWLLYQATSCSRSVFRSLQRFPKPFPFLGTHY
jgi:hypothetical protein